MPPLDYDISLSSRMMSAAGWHPENCDVTIVDDFTIVYNRKTDETRLQMTDVHKSRMDDLGVAP